MNKQNLKPIEKAINVFLRGDPSDPQARAKARAELVSRIGFNDQYITNIIRKGGYLPERNFRKWLEVTGLSIDELYPMKDKH